MTFGNIHQLPAFGPGWAVARPMALLLFMERKEQPPPPIFPVAVTQPQQQPMPMVTSGCSAGGLEQMSATLTLIIMTYGSIRLPPACGPGSAEPTAPIKTGSMAPRALPPQPMSPGDG